MEHEPAKPPPEVAPLNFIYACQLCCASFADVYESHHETVQGFSDGINPKERLITRIFLSNCCHVFCSEHLEGGGPPFHPAEQRPSAPCPVCIKEKGDSQLRDLYSVRGFNKNEYDPQIPPTWFTAPPIRLDGSGKEMEALRFQYIALIRYCQNTYRSRKPLQKAVAETQKKLASMQELASEEHAKVLTLQQENEQLRAKQDQCDAMKAEMQRLQNLEQEVDHYRQLQVNPRDLETFIANKAAIRHYLKLVPMLIDQNDKMKRRLASLGFAMALEPVPNFKGLDPNTFDSDEAFPSDCSGGYSALPRKTASSHTAGRSAHTSGQALAAPSSPFTQRPFKRQRVDSPLPNKMQVDPLNSRDAMPPPPKPMSRMHSVRKMFPTLRKKLSHGRSAPALDSDLQGNDDVQIHDKEYWQNADRNRPSPRNRGRSETPYMSGALPVETTARPASSRESPMLSTKGINRDTSDFTFRASSPIKMDISSKEHRPVQLPTEPSYIRLMDGLSHDSGIELGLKDPRQSPTRSYHDDDTDRQVMYSLQARQLSEEQPLKRWGFGHPFLHQSPHGHSPSVNGRVKTPSSNQTNGFTSRAYNEPNLESFTPAPRRHQQPGHQIESVVSPFFKNSHRRAPGSPRTGFAEYQDSSNRSGASRSQRQKMNQVQAGWHEPRSLNGLSFFDSPVISRNEPIQHSYYQRNAEPITLSRNGHGRSFDPIGFNNEPEGEKALFVSNSVYESTRKRPSYSRPTPPSFRSAAPFSSSRRAPEPRTAQFPSAMQSTFSTRSPVRNQPQWGYLQRVGVRSSRHTFDDSGGNTFDGPTGHLFSRASRHSVRR
ncbi:Nn.00g062200.m01.CDS01 [Neocucurbitaria sp. VM-36]